ncbi:hypothetical protein [Rhodococcoides fascians]|uniref:hypothetical protein n=1 Tax=Rhodococcoides fascians TaxID=1828 RepID=UPI00050BFF9D|nr:hypothetical protein [Rhodococcus fascians]
MPPIKRMPTEEEIQEAAEELVDCIGPDGKYLRNKRTQIVKYWVRKQQIDAAAGTASGTTASRLAEFRQEIRDTGSSDEEAFALLIAVAAALVERDGLLTASSLDS